MATFADSGTMTADFTRWSRNGREAVLAASTAFPVASMVAQLTGGVVVAAGAIAAPATDGGNFLPLLADGAGPLLSALAIVFVFVNLGSVCSHCLYNGAVSWSHIVGGRMRVLTLLLGIAGVGIALAGVWSHFLSWLVILSVFVPPIGAVLIADQVLLRGATDVADRRRRPPDRVRRLGGRRRVRARSSTTQAPQWSDAVVGLVTGAVAYLAIEAVAAPSRDRRPPQSPSRSGPSDRGSLLAHGGRPRARRSARARSRRSRSSRRSIAGWTASSRACTPSATAPTREALDAARALERALAARRRPAARCAACRSAIKDLVAVAGMPMPGGSPAYRDFVPDEDDIVVERLRAAGAIVLGKTDVPEFGYSGASHSPVVRDDAQPVEPRADLGRLERRLAAPRSPPAWARSRSPPTAAARSASRRRFCGLFGMKASMGRVPMYPAAATSAIPGIASWEGLEHIGPISRTVADAALDALRDRRARRRATATRSRRATSTGAPPPSPATCAACASPTAPTSAASPSTPRSRASSAEAVGAFADLGCDVEAADPGVRDPGAAFAALIALESDLTGMREIVDRHGHEMSPHLVDLITARVDAPRTSPTRRRSARRVVNAMWRFMRDYDLLADPDADDAAVPGAHAGAREDRRPLRPRHARGCRSRTRSTSPASRRRPSRPASPGDGLPVGLQIVGGHLADGLVLRAAAAFEAARPWAQHRPPLARWRMTRAGFLRAARAGAARRSLVGRAGRKSAPARGRARPRRRRGRRRRGAPPARRRRRRRRAHGRRPHRGHRRRAGRPRRRRARS